MSIAPLALRRPRTGLRHLASYAPGMADIRSFSQTAVATYRDLNGVLQTAPIGAMRDGHYESGRRSLLIETARTNAFTWSRDLSNAAWTKNEATPIGGGVTGVDGVTAGNVGLVDTTNNAQHYVTRAVTFTANATQAFSGMFKAGGLSRFQMYLNTGSDTVGVAVDLAAATATPVASGAGAHAWTPRIEAWSGGWYRVMWAGAVNAASTSANFYILLQNAAGATTYAGTGTGIYADCLQFEQNSPSVSMPIHTTSATATRALDKLSISLSGAPQAMTIYKRMTSTDLHLAVPGAPRRVFELSSGGAALPFVRVRRVSGGTSGWEAAHQTAAGSVSVSVSRSFAAGDLVHLRCVLYADGSVRLGVAVNSGVETLSARSAPLALPAAFSAAALWLGGDGSANDATLQSVVHRVLVLPGEASMDVCQARGA